jgi:hypothetical protein
MEKPLEKLPAQADEKIWRVVASYSGGHSPDHYFPLETLAEAMAREEEEDRHLSQWNWIERV